MDVKYLGVDYGKKKIGLASGDTESKFAEPLAVVRFENEEKAIEKISQYTKVERVQKVVLGISEGKTAEDTKIFGTKLARELNLPVLYHDETLTTNKAQELSIQAGIKRKKRKYMEDAFAAALMLQDFLEHI